MLLLLLCVGLNVGLIHAKSPTTDVFDFAVCPETEAKHSGRVMFNAAGTIGEHEKIIKIPISVPYCMELTFVHVEVDNPVAPPAVSLDAEYLAVTIKYRPKQPSRSTYLVTAKTIPIKNCNSLDGDVEEKAEAVGGGEGEGKGKGDGKGGEVGAEGAAAGEGNNEDTTTTPPEV